MTRTPSVVPEGNLTLGKEAAHPHFEKIMQMQAEDLRNYAETYAPWRDETYLRAARQIRGYLKNFLTSPEGAFYTSQDADLVPGEHGGDRLSPKCHGVKKTHGVDRDVDAGG
jgi:uncharacterized protein YyaL (SSP411 family)